MCLQQPGSSRAEGLSRSRQPLFPGWSPIRQAEFEPSPDLVQPWTRQSCHEAPGGHTRPRSTPGRSHLPTAEARGLALLGENREDFRAG